MTEKLFLLGFLLIILGFFIIFAAALYGAMSSSDEDEAEVRGGGIVMIGPFPIIFGTDASSVKLLMIMAIILMVFAFLLLYPFWRI
ncbi:MAG: hypothetical protein PWR13_502 [Archaeoglobi archaeon]|nr:DUF131 domain-containing protein [Candidatus Mnemosynella bozhongmuii]MDI3502774.1 hypothetical protein [Archaeoglobi archaeon]MDK2781474.1 hypothetical protein [Archaeoglobi archaeon]